ncbi:hypothetical protein [Streptomyces griseoaurantiacus]|uniref:hypothetical protein n=1 Tax=Streptomyces griseoaurantiacus TaxID=68213 RepID=UPI002E2CA8B9|nr:hypothetical protein [Streptomyces jietaisiensis]
MGSRSRASCGPAAGPGPKPGDERGPSTHRRLSAALPLSERLRDSASHVLRSTRSVAR